MKLLHPPFTTPVAWMSRAVTRGTHRGIVAAAMLALVSVLPASATQTIRELWDGPNNKFALDGAWGDGVSSLGFAPGTTWVASPAGNTTLVYDGTWNLDWEIGDNDSLLPPTASGQGGTLAYYSGNGNMGSSLINPATGYPYGDYYSQCYATRALATNSYVNFSADGTYYFSVRFIGGGGYNWWSGDFAGGVGLASSDATNADFVGAGWTRNSYLAEDGVTDIGKSAYITTGTLDQAGIASHPDDSGGPYYARTNGPARALATIDSSSGNEYGTGALLVGQLITASGGGATMNVKLFFPYAGVPSDPSTITWDATYSFTETNIMTRLLLWQYGTGPSVQDAIRVGTDYGSVVGLELVGAPQATPANTVYAGVAVTLSTTYAGLNTGTYPMTFQWFSNSVPLTDATNATLVLTGTTTNFTADYSVAATNAFGTITSAVTHLTVNPASPVKIVQQPVSTARYVGSPSASFTVVVDGTPPFTYQWEHAGTNILSAVSTSAQTNTVVLPPVALADAGGYSVLVTNRFGSTNSQTATLTLITPPPGSFEAAAVAAGAAAFWRLSETTNDLTPAGVPLHEYMSDLNGNCPDVTNVVFDLPGPNVPGFAGSTSIETWNDGKSSQINLGGMTQYSNTMTMVCWMDASYLGWQGIMLDTGNASGNGLGDGPYYGIDYRLGGLGSQWGDTNSIWDSGITLPVNQWVMVALVIEPNETTAYAGTDPFTFQMVTRSSVEGVSYANTAGTLNNGRLALGRTDYAWAQHDNSWAGMNAQFCDAAVFYAALTPSAITNLFLAGVGVQLGGTPDGAGNLNLNWLAGGTLQEANSVTGPYTDVSGSPTPPYSVPMSPTTPQHYYRVRR